MRLALAGDTMLGRLVGERLAADPTAPLFSDELAAIIREADAFVLNLECAISDRGARWPDPDKRFFFRAPPAAVEVLVDLGVDCVTLANNHALDYGVDALLDTIGRLGDAGIGVVGAGVDDVAARRPFAFEAAGTRIGVVGITDHPAAFAAGPGHAGVAQADLRTETPAWVLDTVGVCGAHADVVVVTPHWGPNLVPSPLPHVRRAAAELRDAGATVPSGVCCVRDRDHRGRRPGRDRVGRGSSVGRQPVPATART
jgi:poly-gamma-glutamate synthesis protein (capsule biosynthesis protein)